MRFIVNKSKDEIAEDLNKKLLQAPALGPYIIAQIAGEANIKVGVPSILSGIPGFEPRTGRTKERGLRAIFRNRKTGFEASLWTPLFNIFTVGTKRGIKRVPIWEIFAPIFESSGIAEDVINQALTDFDSNKIPDLDKYLLLGIRRRRG